MRDRFVFVAIAVVISLALFGGEFALTAADLYLPAYAGYLVPAVAVMAAALGVGWRRKAAFIAALLVIYVAFDLATASYRTQIVTTHVVQIVSPVQFLRPLFVVVDGMVPLVLPLAVLALFVGRDPSVLWTPRAARR